ncbi:MAG: ATP-dependent DNA helicase [Candidatus Saccharibacteria bacterium]|nr:ATP-dependent DNA helicase [Candidatus Saccharibacteria bacterium]
MDFDTRYAMLNDRQRQAVDHIEGPLLVIAGPGTGKTELLSMRAAQILRQTDTLPSSILCLTFTDSGAVNMRERLRQIIGEDAYKVAIHTFHSFGTDIISQHREYFFRGADMTPVDELTQHQILRALFDNLPSRHPLASKNGDDFTYLGDTLRTISEFKQSGLTPDELHAICDDNQRVMDAISPALTATFAGKITKHTIETFAKLAQTAAAIPTRPLPGHTTSYVEVLSLSLAHTAQAALADNSTKPITAWRNDWCKKDAHGEFQLKDALALEKLRASIDLYEAYSAELANRRAFDYDDMILTVLSTLEQHPDLKANLREQFQYIMVDEFQDTNNAQLQLLLAISGEGREPNVMAVGDDDQAIFSFQGADVGNIQKFRRFYADPPIVVLTDNYRSADVVLTAAREVITQGSDRLESTIDGLSKQLTPHADATGANVTLTEYASPSEERAGLARQIKRLIDSGTPPSDIAVLARRHYELIDLLPYLSAEGIQVNYERRDNALEQEVVRSLLLVARIVLALSQNQQDEANALIPELLAHPAFGFAPRDIWQLSLGAYKQRALWLEQMLASTTFSELANWLLERAAAARTEPLEQQLDELLGAGEASLAAYYFSPAALAAQPDAYLSALEALRTLRDRLRDHFTTDTPTLAQLIEFVDLTTSLGARITVVRQRADHQAGAIHLMSAHKAKGLEFPHVFVIGATDGAWGEKARGKSRLIRYPANLPLAPAGANYDERLRLFFVAMTRAKSTLSISYARTDSTGKDSLIASFLSRHTPRLAPQVPDIASATQTLETDWRARLTAPLTTDLRTVLAPTLERYKLSATHLNNFLDVSRGGPQYFLLNNLLRFPQAKSPAAGYGTAMHAALQHAHGLVRADGALPDHAVLLDYFTGQLRQQHLPERDFQDLNDKGRAALSAFLTARAADFTPTQLAELNFSGQGVVVGQARLTGALDLADIDPEQKTIFVTDYKTGKPAPTWRGRTDYEKIKLHKYRQQLLFYQLLVTQSRDYSSYTFTGGRLQFVEPDPQTGEILALEEQLLGEELAEFTRLIDIVWQRIMRLDLPDISSYSADYKGMVAFERDLLEGAI